MDKQQSKIGSLRIAVAVGVGVISYAVQPSTGSVATAHAQECTQANCGTINPPPPPAPPPPQDPECDDGFCGAPANPGGGCGCGCGSGCLVGF
jgi:hypothetical protein